MPCTPCPCSLHHCVPPWLSFITSWVVRLLASCSSQCLCSHILVLFRSALPWLSLITLWAIRPFDSCLLQCLSCHILVSPPHFPSNCGTGQPMGNQGQLALACYNAYQSASPLCLQRDSTCLSLGWLAYVLVCTRPFILSCVAGGVAAIVAALLRDGTAPKGLGPVRCCVISPAAVFSGALSEACRPFITSLILRWVYSYDHSSIYLKPASPSSSRSSSGGSFLFIHPSVCLCNNSIPAALQPCMPSCV